MRIAISLFATALVFSTAVPALACGGDDAKTAQKSVKTITVGQLATMMTKQTKAKKQMLQTIDVNSDTTRTSMGVIPGSVMLTSSAKYDTASLGKDKSKTQVFYCSNTKCGASKTAAKKAMKAGFEDVRVLPVGIKGWKEAGQKTAQLKPLS